MHQNKQPRAAAVHASLRRRARQLVQRRVNEMPDRPVREAALRVVDRVAVRGVKDRPIFLGGCPRSGTTLLRTMLHAHPDLAIPRETHFVLEAYWRRAQWGDLADESNRRRLANWIVDDYRTTRFRRLELDPDEARRRLMAAPPTLGSIVGTAFIMYAEQHKATRWGDKRPMHVEELPAIFAMFPDVQFVNIVRDPRAVIASMRKLGWLEQWFDGTIVGAADRWLWSVRAGRRARRRYRDDQFLELRYEDLLTDPAGHLERICRFTGLTDDHLDAMLRFHDVADIPDRQHGKFHPLLNKPLTMEAAHSWTSWLSDGEVAFIEQVLKAPMARYGYDPVARGTTPAKDLLRRWRQHDGRRQGPRGPTVVTAAGPVTARLTTAQRRRAMFAR